MSPKQRKTIIFGVLILELSVGTYMRLTKPETLPDLEHDEALICIGAQRIFLDHAHPLTGDKVYEGPLLEYLSAFLMYFSGNPYRSARYVVGISGILSLILLFLIGTEISSPLMGLFTVLLAILNPWSISSARVVYSCNLSQLFLPLFILSMIYFLKTHKFVWLAIGSMSIGFLANGRISALFFIIPMLLTIFFSAEKKSLYLPVFLLFCLALVPVLPVLIYNARSGWPLIAVGLDPHQNHLILSVPSFLHTYPARFIALLKTAVRSLDGLTPWIDIEVTTPHCFFPFSILAFSGILFSFINSHKRKLILLSTTIPMIFALVIIPLITKHATTPEGKLYYHPHYLDLLMPFLVIFSGMALTSIWGKKNFLARILALGFILSILGFQVFQVNSIVEQMQEGKVVTRWNRGYGKAAQFIQKHLPASEYSVIADWRFQYGYPQLRCLLNDYQVVPYLPPFHGIPGLSGNVAVVTSQSMESRFPTFTRLTNLRYPQKDPLLILIGKTPGVILNGTVLDNDGNDCAEIHLTSAGNHNNWDGTLVLPQANEQNTIKFRIFSLRVQTSTNDSIAQLVTRVTPRHRSELKRLSLSPSGNHIVGKTDQGEPVIIDVSIHGTATRISGHAAGNNFSGIFFGTYYPY